VTREVPLPYVFTGEPDSDDEAEGSRPRRRSIRLPVISGKDHNADVEGEAEER
jgi:hypothetical protein